MIAAILILGFLAICCAGILKAASLSTLPSRDLVTATRLLDEVLRHDSFVPAIPEELRTEILQFTNRQHRQIG